jgi:hypothetical protein
VNKSFNVTNVVSSAYKTVRAIFFKIPGKSLIYTLNNIGPRTEPWGTPNFTDEARSKILKVSSLISTPLNYTGDH